MKQAVNYGHPKNHIGHNNHKHKHGEMQHELTLDNFEKLSKFFK